MDDRDLRLGGHGTFGFVASHPIRSPARSLSREAAAQLCQALGIDRLAAVVGISAGGRTALMVAARHPRPVERVILQSTVAFLPWPGRLTHLGGRAAFTPESKPARGRSYAP
ncbi:alpha/beta fold hydrolase [Nonomuraea sp. NPDC004297]